MVSRYTWRQLHSELTIDVSIYPKSPLLIQMPKDIKDNSIEFLSYKQNDKEVYYIPGSSIKGVLRNHTEKVFYHLFSEDPLKFNNFKPDLFENSTELYNSIGLTNQLFGHQLFRGRLSIDDAVFYNPKIENRTNIAVDRFRGGAKSGALFESEYITAGYATSRIYLKNPEVWQIVWLAFLIRDLNEGKITLGANSSIGSGEVNIEIKKINIDLYNKELEKEWKNWLSKGTKSKSILYISYLFNNLEDIVNSLEKEWELFYSKNRKEGETE